MIEADGILDTDLDAARRRVAGLPLWRGQVRPEILPGGLSNRNFVVRDGEDTYVARLVGGDDPAHGIVRAREIAVSRAAHRAGIAPELVHAEPGLLVLRLIAGRTLTAAEVGEAAMLRRIAALLRRCHSEVAAHLRGPAPCFWVFHALRNYLAALASHRAPAGRIERLRRIVDALEGASGPTRLALTHNDLMPGNLIDDGARLWLIDWEYAGFGAPLRRHADRRRAARGAVGARARDASDARIRLCRLRRGARSALRGGLCGVQCRRLIPRESPSPASREREGPIAQQWEGE